MIFLVKQIRSLKEENERLRDMNLSNRKSKRTKIRNAECHRRSRSQTDDKSERLRRNLLRLEQENNELRLEIDTLKSKSFDLQMVAENQRQHAKEIKALKKEHDDALKKLSKCSKCDKVRQILVVCTLSTFYGTHSK